MTPIIPHRKEKPLTSLASLGGGATGLQFGGGAKEKLYMDDVFSTFLYKGDDGGNRHVDNGIDINGEGGLVLVNRREGGSFGGIYVGDTARGLGKQLFTASSTSESNVNRIKPASGSNTGFNVNSDSDVNSSNYNYASWTFRKEKGFFDIVTYTGNGSNRTISHNLGTVPGMVIIKKTSGSDPWYVWHRDLSNNTKTLSLNSSDGESGNAAIFNSTAPTATEFSLGTSGHSNENNYEYVAYLFAGGASTAATARSIDLDGSEGIDVAASSALSLGTSNFCIEGWIYVDTAPGTGSPSFGRFFQLDGPTVNAATTNLQITINPNYTIYVQQGSDQLISGVKPLRYKWNHIAVTRVGNTITVYVNGIPDGTTTTTQNFNPNSGSPRVRLGYADNTSSNNGVFDGKISNVRVTIGEPVYTSAFRVPTEPLTTTSQGVTASNVKLICCNGSTTISSTVTPATITAAGSPTASTFSPFDDPDGFKFGEEINENMIKCGSYIGNGSATGSEIFLGWEPQWVLIKNTNLTSENWFVLDNIRGIVTNDTEAALSANVNVAETDINLIDLTSTGFKTQTADDKVNGSGHSYIYMAIRRPDGYVGKPPELGTDVFSLVVGGASPNPTFRTGFPMDFAITKEPASSNNWHTGSRLTGNDYLYTNTTAAAQSASWLFGASDYNNGYAHTYYSSSDQSWAWKRHAGFTVCTWDGDGVVGRQIPHDLNKAPEMIWVKNRNNTGLWIVGHEGLNSGSTPWGFFIRLDDSGAQIGSPVWNNTVPSATHFSVSAGNSINASGRTYMAMLFASVDGISKVGYYTGDGSNEPVTTGFQPRFIIIRRVDYSEDWFVFDSLRGLASGSNDPYLRINTTDAQTGSASFFDVSSTGFTVTANFTNNNVPYIYYAHA